MGLGEYVRLPVSVIEADVDATTLEVVARAQLWAWRCGYSKPRGRLRGIARELREADLLWIAGVNRRDYARRRLEAAEQWLFEAGFEWTLNGALEGSIGRRKTLKVREFRGHQVSGVGGTYLSLSPPAKRGGGIPRSPSGGDSPAPPSQRKGDASNGMTSLRSALSRVGAMKGET
jgi:hypothetical protein